MDDGEWSGDRDVRNANAATTATFGAAGSYVLRLTGNDSQRQAADDVAIVVSDAGPANAAPVVSAGPDRTVTRPDAAAWPGR